jgi:hypothetical protein
VNFTEIRACVRHAQVSVGPTLVKLTQGLAQGHLKNWNACQHTSEIPSRFYMHGKAPGCVSFTEWRALGEFLVKLFFPGDTWSVITWIKTKRGVSKNETPTPVLEEKFRAGRRPAFRLQKSAQCFMVGKKSDTDRDVNTYRRMVGRRGLLGGGPGGEVTLKVEHFIFFLLES